MTGRAIMEEGGGGVAAPDPAAVDMARAQLRMLRFLADDPASRPSIRTAARRELAELQKHHGADLAACAAAEGQ